MSAIISIVHSTSFTTFGEILRFLRRRVQLTQCDLAIAVGYSEAHICRLEQNRRAPDLPMLQALFVPALDLETKHRNAPVCDGHTD